MPLTERNCNRNDENSRIFRETNTLSKRVVNTYECVDSKKSNKLRRSKRPTTTKSKANEIKCQSWLDLYDDEHSDSDTATKPKTKCHSRLNIGGDKHSPVKAKTETKYDSWLDLFDDQENHQNFQSNVKKKKSNANVETKENILKRKPSQIEEEEEVVSSSHLKKSSIIITRKKQRKLSETFNDPSSENEPELLEDKFESLSPCITDKDETEANKATESVYENESMLKSKSLKKNKVTWERKPRVSKDLTKAMEKKLYEDWMKECEEIARYKLRVEVVDHDF